MRDSKLLSRLLQLVLRSNINEFEVNLLLRNNRNFCESTLILKIRLRFHWLDFSRENLWQLSRSCLDKDVAPNLLSKAVIITMNESKE